MSVVVSANSLYHIRAELFFFQKLWVITTIIVVVLLFSDIDTQPLVKVTFSLTS
jgi:hypothetical protein